MRNRMFFGVCLMILFLPTLVYGIGGMSAGQMYFGEDNLYGAFYMFISMLITFGGSFVVFIYGAYLVRTTTIKRKGVKNE